MKILFITIFFLLPFIILLNSCSSMYDAVYKEDIQYIKNYKGNINTIISQDGTTPLLYAAYYGKSRSILSLLDAGANIDSVNTQGASALILAAYFGFSDIVDILIDAHANTEISDTNGWTALMEISQNIKNSSIDKQTNIIKALISAGVNVNKMKKDGWTSLMLASYYGQIEVIKALINAKVNVNASDTNGRTALMEISQNENKNSTEIQIEIIKTLIGAGANVNSADSNDITALMFATGNNQIEAIICLIDAKADINAVNRIGLSTFSCTKDPVIIKILSTNGSTPSLFDSVYKDDLSYISNYKGNINITNKDGGTPLILAATFGKIEMVNTLI